MVRITLQVQHVLRALLEDPERELYGLEIVEATGLPPGSIYPILARLEAASWVVSRWEVIDRRAEGRPRRRYYRFAPDGMRQAQSALSGADSRRQARVRSVTSRAVPGGAL
jgi:DNA-binding PadR family transcriptional regulator